MTVAEKIVHRLLEDDAELARELTNKNLLYDVAEVEYEFDFAFAVVANVQDDDIGDVNQADINWVDASRDLVRVEHNVLYALGEIGVHTRPDGHNSSDELVGGAWFTLNPPNGVVALRFMEDYLNRIEEPYQTSSGTLPGFIEKELFNGVTSEIVRRFADVSLEFYETEELAKFFELVGENGSVEDTVIQLRQDKVTESFLGAVEPSGVFKSLLGGRTTFSAKCPGCERLHGNFRTFEEASGNKMCRYCIRSYVDKIKKAGETGNFKPLLRQDNHAKARR